MTKTPEDIMEAIVGIEDFIDLKEDEGLGTDEILLKIQDEFKLDRDEATHLYTGYKHLQIEPND